MPTTGNRNAIGVSLPREHMADVRELVVRLGTRGAARQLGVSRDAVVQALAGLGLRKTTIKQIVEHLPLTKLSFVEERGEVVEERRRPGLRKSGGQRR